MLLGMRGEINNMLLISFIKFQVILSIIQNFYFCEPRNFFEGGVLAFFFLEKP